MDTWGTFVDVGDIASAIAEGDKRITVNVDDYYDTFSAYDVDEQRNNYSFCVIGELVDDEAELSNYEFITFREYEASGSDYVMRNCFRGKDYTLDKSHTTDEIILSQQY